MFQEVRRKAVPQHVRRNISRDPRTANALLHPQPQRHSSERSASLSQKYVGRGTWFHQARPAGIQISIDRLQSFASNWDHPFLVSLADYIDKSGIQMQLLKPQPTQFR